MISLVLAILTFAAAARAQDDPRIDPRSESLRTESVRIARQDHLRDRMLQAALDQIGVTRYYDPSYRRLDYPGGDLPAERGVCTDVVVRAFRTAGVDLQALVHEDMTRDFVAYPNLWGLSGPDPNIDHRRVPNLMTFFTRQGKALPVTTDESAYQAGDLVAWCLPDGANHIGIVARECAPGTARPLIIHNIGAGTALADILFEFEIIGHYRYF